MAENKKCQIVNPETLKLRLLSTKNGCVMTSDLHPEQELSYCFPCWLPFFPRHDFIESIRYRRLKSRNSLPIHFHFYHSSTCIFWLISIQSRRVWSKWEIRDSLYDSSSILCHGSASRAQTIQIRVLFKEFMLRKSWLGIATSKVFDWTILIHATPISYMVQTYDCGFECTWFGHANPFK